MSDQGIKSHTIGFVCNSSAWGGLEMNVLRLAQWLRDRGWKMMIYGDRTSVLAGQANRAGISFSHLASRFKFGDLVNARRLVMMTERDGVRILIVHQNRDILLTVLARILSRRFFKLVYMQHMQLGMAKRDLFHTWEYGKLDAWIAPLPGFRVSLREKTRLDPERVHIIPLGIEIDRFGVSPANKAQARRELELPDKAAIAGVVGRLDPKKGQDVLIKACAGLHRAGINLHLLIVGDRTIGETARYASKLKELTEQLELTPYVHFRPHRENVEIVYGAMDVFVLPSQSETYGMVTLEAMAAGVPVIGTRSGGTREIIDDGMNGLLFPPDDDEALAAALKSTLEDHDSAQKRAQRARKDVARKYSHTRQCHLMESLFDQLIA